MTQSAVSSDLGSPMLISVEEAAHLLRIGRTRCFQLVLAGRIRSVKLGRRRLVIAAGLEEFVKSLAAQQSVE